MTLKYSIKEKAVKEIKRIIKKNQGKRIFIASKVFGKENLMIDIAKKHKTKVYWLEHFNLLIIKVGCIYWKINRITKNQLLSSVIYWWSWWEYVWILWEEISQKINEITDVYFFFIKILKF